MKSIFKKCTSCTLAIMLVVALVLCCTVVTVGATDTLTLYANGTAIGANGLTTTVGQAPIALTAFNNGEPVVNDDGLEWETTNASVASVTQRYGQLVCLTATSTAITITANQYDTDGVTLLATGSFSLIVNAAASGAYGYQGLNNTMLLYYSDNTSTNYSISYNSNNATAYENTIYPTGSSTSESIDPASDGYYYITFTMTAGINNFGDGSNFRTYNDEKISILDDSTMVAIFDPDNDYTLVSDKITYVGFLNRIITLKVATSALQTNTTYTLSFDSTLCGNNTSKTLGKDVNFTFKTPITFA